MPTAAGRVLGILVSSADDKFESALIRGVADAVSRAGGGWICFTSGAIRSHRGFEFQRNMLYDLVSDEVVHGLVVSGTLGHVVSHEELLAFCRSYAPLPLVTVAVGLEGIPKVLNSSYRGIRDVVHHLTNVHKYKNIGFLRGPAGHQEAEERLRAFLDGMKVTGRSEEELFEWVGDGEYTHESGRKAMTQLLDRSLPLEAVISSNDSMALGALEILREKGLKTPGDIAITGFDDTDEGRQNLPPLTTVYQSVYDMGRHAGEMLLAGLRDGAYPDEAIVQPSLVIRQSCGCLEQSLIKAVRMDEGRGNEIPDPVELQKKVVAAMTEAVSLLQHMDMPRWMEEIHASFMDDVRAKGAGQFLATWKKVIHAGRRAGAHSVPWQDALSAMRGIVLPALKDDVSAQKAELLWQQARVLIGEELLKIETATRLQVEQRNVILREITEILMTCHSLSELLDAIELEFPRLGIHACYIALFDRAAVSTENARLIFAYDRSGRRALTGGGVMFHSRRLLPGVFSGSLGQSGLVAEALYSKEHRLGFMLLELDAENAMVCSALRGVLSNALQGVILEEQRNEAEAQLRHYQADLEIEVEERTSELRTANQKLAAEITERLRTEVERENLIHELEMKNAELERFAYTASHDLKSPIITIRGFLGYLENDAVAGNISRLKEDIQRIGDAADKMYALLNDLLELSRIGRVMNPPERVAFTEIVETAMELVAGRLKENRVEVKVIPSDQYVFGDRRRLVEVFQNLLDNSAKFTRGRASPRIEIGCNAEAAGRLLCYVRDNGIGIAPEHHERIFGLFNKLNPEIEGTGVGLALVKRIVELYQGKIWVKSELDQGAAFYFTLPLAVD